MNSNLGNIGCKVQSVLPTPAEFTDCPWPVAAGAPGPRVTAPPSLEVGPRVAVALEPSLIAVALEAAPLIRRRNCEGPRRRNLLPSFPATARVDDTDASVCSGWGRDRTRE